MWPQCIIFPEFTHHLLINRACSLLNRMKAKLSAWPTRFYTNGPMPSSDIISHCCPPPCHSLNSAAHSQRGIFCIDYTLCLKCVFLRSWHSCLLVTPLSADSPPLYRGPPRLPELDGLLSLYHSTLYHTLLLDLK